MAPPLTDLVHWSMYVSIAHWPGDEDDRDSLSLQGTTVDLPRSSATKRKPSRTFKSPPKKKTTPPSQGEAAPSNVPAWMQQPFLPNPLYMGQGNMPNPWTMGQQFPGCAWLPPPPATQTSAKEVPTTKAESEARATRRAIRKEMEERVDARRSQGQKPHRVRVKPGGGIDGGCEGKNEFDEQLRTLVPRILDVSCVSWKDQHPGSVEKLRSALDATFEYVGNHLTDKGFTNAVKRQMKTERSKMKGWFLGGRKECPVTIEPDQWARLCDYWSKPETEEKAQRMANARKAVKRTSTVGRAGKAGKEAQLVGQHCFVLWLFTACYTTVQ